MNTYQIKLKHNALQLLNKWIQITTSSYNHYYGILERVTNKFYYIRLAQLDENIPKVLYIPLKKVNYLSAICRLDVPLSKDFTPDNNLLLE